VRVQQGEEPPEFRSLFNGGLNFKQGGVASGFRSAKKASAPAKLYHVALNAKGAAQVTEVQPSVSSLSKTAWWVRACRQCVHPCKCCVCARLGLHQNLVNLVNLTFLDLSTSTSNLASARLSNANQLLSTWSSG
jgi:hypothetical protein